MSEYKIEGTVITDDDGTPVGVEITSGLDLGSEMIRELAGLMLMDWMNGPWHRDYRLGEAKRLTINITPTTPTTTWEVKVHTAWRTEV